MHIIYRLLGFRQPAGMNLTVTTSGPSSMTGSKQTLYI